MYTLFDSICTSVRYYSVLVELVLSLKTFVSSIGCYSVSEEACRAHPVFVHSLKALVVLLVLSDGIYISIWCYSVSVEDCKASHVAT